MTRWNNNRAGFANHRVALLRSLASSLASVAVLLAFMQAADAGIRDLGGGPARGKRQIAPSTYYSAGRQFGFYPDGSLDGYGCGNPKAVTDRRHRLANYLNPADPLHSSASLPNGSVRRETWPFGNVTRSFPARRTKPLTSKDPRLKKPATPPIMQRGRLSVPIARTRRLVIDVRFPPAPGDYKAAGSFPLGGLPINYYVGSWQAAEPYGRPPDS